MKKTVLAVLAVAMAFNFSLNAQTYGDSRLGIKAGLTSSSAKIKDVDTKSISQYHIGLAYEIPLGGGFALQPEVLYQVKGMALGQWSDTSTGEIASAFETKVGYLEVPVQLQWGPDLMLFRPYAFVEPFLGYRLTQSSDGAAKLLSDHLKKVEYGLSVGAGIDIWKLQVAIKYFWNFGDIYETDIKSTGSTISGLLDGNTFNGIAVSAALFF